MAIKILQIDLQNDITPQIGSYDNAGGVTPNNWRYQDGVYSLGPTNVDGRTPYYWFTPTREVTDFDLCWEDYQDHEQTTPQYHLEIGDSAGNVVLSVLRQHANYYIGPVSVGNLAYRTWYKILIAVRKASASSSIVTAYVNGKKVATGTSNTLLTSAKIALLGHVPNIGYMQNAGQRLRYVTIYDRSYTSKGINLDGMMTTITALISKLIAKLSTVALTGSYNDLSDKPTIPTVNNATLTIQKNGSNVATFTANQSTAATANITVPTAVSELANDSGYLTASSNLDASKLTSGTVDIARLPQGALERLVKVANEAARYALTTADVQLGDTVQQLDTGIMYVVTDTDHLDSAAGYTEYTAGTAASVPWSGVTGKPTFAAVATSGVYSDLTGTPTIPTVNNATLTIQKNGTTVGTFSANQATDETVNITVPDVNNGTLTIQKNGTTVDTFTANSSTDKTVNITVPTKTSDLTNDSDFVQSSDLATVATSGNYNDLSNKPTIPTVNNATLTIQKNGTNVQTFTANQSTNATANIIVPTKTSDLTNDSGFITSDNTKIPLAGSNQISGSLIPATDNSIDVGSSTKNIKMVYTKGITINGTQFLPSNYVPRSGGAVMTTYNFGRNVDNDEFRLHGGTDYNLGASVVLYGKNNQHAHGRMFLHPSDGTNARVLNLEPNGTFTWDGTAIQYTSDQRLKQQIDAIDDKLLDAWEDVTLVQFKYNDAVDQKGKDKARLHTGYVVQQIDKACKEHGVDVSAYGLYCHEQYPEETEEVEVEQEDGTKVKETKVIREASEHYSLRYTEVYAVECMYLRRCIERLTARIEELEKGKEAEK